jgi:hypothetical protein
MSLTVTPTEAFARAMHNNSALYMRPIQHGYYGFDVMALISAGIILTGTGFAICRTCSVSEAIRSILA